MNGSRSGILHPEDAGTGGAEHLVAGKRKKVAADPGDIDRHVRDRLGAVNKEQGAMVVADPGNLLQRA